MNIKKLFNNLSTEEKVDFFINCQDLLIKYHADSDFVIRENNLEQAVEIFSEQINKYKGFSYSDNYVFILFNYIFIENKELVNEELIKNIYKNPINNYNAISLDFVACRSWSDTFKFIEEVNEDRIKYLLLVKNGIPKIYEKNELINKIKFF